MARCFPVLGIAVAATLGGCCLDVGEPTLTSAATSSSGAAALGSSTGAVSPSAGQTSSTGISSASAPSGTTSGNSSGTSSGGTTGSSSGNSSTGSTTGAIDAGPTIWIGGGLEFDLATQAYNNMCLDLYDGQYLNTAAVIDGQGDLWAMYGLNLMMWTPAQLLAHCVTPTQILIPDARIFDGGLELDLTALAFDSNGNLWASTSGAPAQVVGFAAQDLVVPDGDLKPIWALAGDCGSSNSLCSGGVGLAFDSSGYLWVGNHDSVVAFAPNTLMAAVVGAEGSEPHNTPADLVITSSIEGIGFNYPAFDADGNLWVSIDGSAPSYQIAEFSEAQLENLNQNASPAPVFAITETALQKQMGFGGWGPLAFDAKGNLWTGSQLVRPPQGPELPLLQTYDLFRFSPASLADGGLADFTLEIFANQPVASLVVNPIPPGLPIRP